MIRNVPDGWRYVALPDSIYAIEPGGRSHYLSAQDHRFRALREGFSLDQACTYGFLGLGPFHPEPTGGMWRQGRFVLPNTLLGVLGSFSKTERESVWNSWRNAYTRSPEMSDKLIWLLGKEIMPFTKDGMVFWVSGTLPDQKEMSGYGFKFFGGPRPKLGLEEQAAQNGLQLTKTLREQILATTLRLERFPESLISDTKHLLEAFDLDSTVEVLTSYDAGRACNSSGWSKDWAGVPVWWLRLLGKKELKTCPVKAMNLLGEHHAKFVLLFEYVRRDKKLKDPEEILQATTAWLRRHRIESSTDLFGFFTSLNAGMNLSLYGKKSMRLVNDSDFLIRSPRSLIELVGWGHQLKNCMRHRTSLPDKPTLMGVFDKKDGLKLIALVSFTFTGGWYQVAQLRCFDNKSLPKDLNQKVLDSIESGWRKKLKKTPTEGLLRTQLESHS